jgi:hypothetical protein
MKTSTNIGKIRLIGACLIMCATAAWACWIIEPAPGCLWITTCLDDCSATCDNSCAVVYQTCPPPVCWWGQCVNDPAKNGGLFCFPLLPQPVLMYCENDIYYYDSSVCDKWRSEGLPDWEAAPCGQLLVQHVQEQGALQPELIMIPNLSGSCSVE